MISRKLVVAVMVTVCSIKVIGCGGEAAPSKQLVRTQASPSSVSPGRTAGQTLLAGNHVRPLHRDTPHRDTPREAFRTTIRKRVSPSATHGTTPWKKVT